MSEYEKYVAIREGAQNTASDDYFTPRPTMDEKKFHTVFKAGFERAYDLRESELTALREKCAELEKDMQVVKGMYHGACDIIKQLEGNEATIAELQRQLDKMEEEWTSPDELRTDYIQVIENYQRQMDEAAKQDIWQPLTGPGQIREGYKVRFILAGKTITATAKLILHSGTDREEIIYNRAKNHYFITSMAVDGTSQHKSVEFLSSPNLPAIIEQAKTEEREECAKACEKVWRGSDPYDIATEHCAKAIRARKP